MATYSSILIQRIPCTEEPSKLHAMGSQIINTTELTYTHAHTSHTVCLSPDMFVLIWNNSLSQFSLPHFLLSSLSHTFNLVKKHLSVVPENMPQSICLCFLLESFHLFYNSYITCKLKVRAKDLIIFHSFIFLISVHIKLCK